MNFTVAKKRKLNKKETEVVKALERVIRWVKKNYPEEPCGDFCPDCPACKMYAALGYLYSLKSDLEY